MRASRCRSPVTERSAGFGVFERAATRRRRACVARRAYHETLGQLIPAYGGTLEHFAGDGVMIFFNDPVPIEEHELQAIRLALAAQERLGELAGGWRKRGIPLRLR